MPPLLLRKNTVWLPQLLPMLLLFLLPTRKVTTGTTAVPPAMAKLLATKNDQTELDEERTDGIEVDGSVNESDGEGNESKGKDEGNDDHNWK